MIKEINMLSVLKFGIPQNSTFGLEALATYLMALYIIIQAILTLTEVTHFLKPLSCVNEVGCHHRLGGGSHRRR